MPLAATVLPKAGLSPRSSSASLAYSVALEATIEISDVYDELHALAARKFRGQRGNHTLQATALVHEAWLRIADRDDSEFNDHTHFMAVAAKAMRHVLVDHARRIGALKRGGEQHRVTLQTGDGAGRLAPPTDVLDLEHALGQLEQLEGRLAQVVEFKFFAGMTIPEIAGALGVSEMTVSNDWRRARIWLTRELE